MNDLRNLGDVELDVYCCPGECINVFEAVYVGGVVFSPLFA